ncbi:MAG: O-antigen ligase family protein, partial [Chloroflexi bacterium]|nr:O-antigen ligase family protein [Chloroflexota bacterium]
MMFRDNPIAGVGLDNYSVLYQSYSRQIGLDPRLQARDAHNLYLEVGAETGLLGLGVFSVLLVSMARGVIRGWNIFKEKNDQEYAGLVLAIG